MTKPNPADPAALSPDWLDRQIAAMLDEDEDAPGPEDNLVHFGLDSVRVMEFAGRLQGLGIQVGYAELIAAPNAAAWWRLIDAARRHG